MAYGRGHVRGHKKERGGHNWLMQTEEYDAEIQRLEAEWKAKQADKGK
jgi:hypothetical protein